MKPKFEIEIDQFKTIHKLPDSWSKQDLLDILEETGFDADDSNSESDLYEYISMAFADLEPTEAAEIVINQLFSKTLNKNQIKEVALEMQTENLWEEYGDMHLHEELFKATSLLYHAYNGKFPHPDAANFSLRINTLNHDAETVLTTIDETLIARLLAKGMSEHAVIFRLFKHSIDTGNWTEAKDIIWQYTITNKTPKSVEIAITTAVYWVKELKNRENYTVELKND